MTKFLTFKSVLVLLNSYFKNEMKNRGTCRLFSLCYSDPLFQVNSYIRISQLLCAVETVHAEHNYTKSTDASNIVIK